MNKVVWLIVIFLSSAGYSVFDNVCLAALSPPTNLTVDTGSSGIFPNSSNTGVPAGVSLTSSGSITTSTNGQIIDSRDIAGTVTINHNNVTVSRSRIRGSGWQTVLVKPGVTGTQFLDCEIDGKNAGEINGSLSMSRCNVHNINGIVPGNYGVYSDNWIHDIYGANSSDHTECFRLQGGQTGNVISHNTLDMTNSTGGTAVVFINAYWGNITNNKFDSNMMIGGGRYGYSVYSTSNTSSGCSASSCVTSGTEYTNNIIQKGAFGYVYPASGTGTTVIKSFTNNKDSISGVAITPPSFIVVK